MEVPAGRYLTSDNILIFLGGAGNAELARLNACNCAGKAGNRPWLQSAYLEEVFFISAEGNFLPRASQSQD